MRFALAATSIAAVAAIPLAFAAAGPNMTGEQFLSSVSCVAQQEVQGAEVGAAKSELNWEAHRQSAETVAEALDAVRDIAAGMGPSGIACAAEQSGNVA
ncbi:MAG: hypothetical protein ABL883_00190 [Terricaulis sp.]